MRRVVVTGLGIVSSIGNNTQEVLASLREAKSGIVKADDYERLGFRCQVHGAPNCDLSQIDRRARRFMGDGAAWNYISMQQAIADSGLEEKDVKNERTGLIMGSGGISTRTLVAAADTTREKGPKRVGPFAVPAVMSSTNSATLATPFSDSESLALLMYGASPTNASCHVLVSVPRPSVGSWMATMSRRNLRANSKSRWSPHGTAMMAPVP